jgi:beta-phosphoglucomutase-like phosphatase (HAD superfamily)
MENMDLNLPLIIFDCDGVLVDTEGLTNRHLGQLFSSLGFKIDEDACRARFQGKTMLEVCADVSAVTGEEIDHTSVRRSINGALRTGVRAIDEVECLVETLIERSYPVCVASNGTVDKMQTTLSQTRLMPLLNDVLFSADDVARGKPAPDLFEYAAHKMGCDIRNSIVIEDSLPGVRAGTTAGARVLGYCGDPFTNKDELSNAGAETFEGMKTALQLICAE